MGKIKNNNGMMLYGTAMDQMSKNKLRPAVSGDLRDGVEPINAEDGSKFSICCDLRAELDRGRAERDAALEKLGKTRTALKDTADKLSLSNRRKNQVEKAICKQLTKTHDVLKKAKGNLENYSS